MDDKVREARGTLKAAIMKVEASVWDKLLGSLDADPWGRPYRIVTKKLKKSSPLTCEQLRPQTVQRIVDSLFPNHPIMEREEVDVEWSEELAITEKEVAAAIKKISNNKTPEPDGIMGRIIKLTQESLLPAWTKYLNKCFREKYFPVK